MIRDPELLAKAVTTTANVPMTGQEDVQKYDYYSLLPYPTSGTYELRFFSVAVGSVIPNTNITATQYWTNLNVPNQIEAPCRFILENIFVDYYPNVEAIDKGVALKDMYNVLSKGYLTLVISSKPYQKISPVLKVGGMSYIPSWENTRGLDTTPSFSSFGCVIPVMEYNIFPTIQLVSNITFNVVINWDNLVPLTNRTAGTFDIISVTLSGHLVRLAQ